MRLQILILNKAIFLVTFLGIFPVPSAVPALAQEWPHYGGDAGGSKYSPLNEINRENVKKLQVAWTYHTGDVSQGDDYNLPTRSAFECTPLVVGGVMYITTPFARVIALEAESGKPIWSFDPKLDKARPYPQFVNRGVALWREGKQKKIFYGTLDGRLFALNAADGKPISTFGTGGFIDLTKDTDRGYPGRLNGMTSPPLVYKDLVIAGSVVSDTAPLGPSGEVRAFDVRTGNLVWTFHNVAQPGEPGHDTWEGDSWKNRGGANAWSILSFDEQRGIIYLPLTSPAYDAYGGDRKGKNLFGDALVALDALTGTLIWYYQIVHHDIWDFDLPAQPALINVRHGGKTVPAIVEVTKMGLVFAFNRITGEPIFAIEERPVPGSKIPGEQAWPTQPFPVKPPPIARQTMTADEVTDVTPESRAECLALLKGVTLGHLYDPYGPAFNLQFPSGDGGSDWGGASYDPESNLLFVNSMDVGVIGKLVKAPVDSGLAYRYRSNSSGYFWDANQHPCQKPPWGRMTAIDMNTGDIRWQVPLGVHDDLLAKGIPPTGALNMGGSIATAGGLVFIAATTDSRFRAFDRDTGAELWTTNLPASGFATPMTFKGAKSHKQYVVIAAGGGHRYGGTKFSDSLIAYTLP
jgi:glucose dehydrogenase